VKPRVFLLAALVFYILGDPLFASVFPYGRDVVTVRPEFSSPELFLDFRHSGEDLSRRDAFHDASDLGRSIRRDGLDEKVDMVLVRAYLEKVDLVTKGDVLADFLHDHVHFLGDDRSSVLGRTDEVVDQNADVVTFVDIGAHAIQYTSHSCFAGAVRGKPRGI
jgi:hypothetical protein